jgi:hypothetical protein
MPKPFEFFKRNSPPSTTSTTNAPSNLPPQASTSRNPDDFSPSLDLPPISRSRSRTISRENPFADLDLTGGTSQLLNVVTSSSGDDIVKASKKKKPVSSIPSGKVISRIEKDVEKDWTLQLGDIGAGAEGTGM